MKKKRIILLVSLISMIMMVSCGTKTKDYAESDGTSGSDDTTVSDEINTDAIEGQASYTGKIITIQDSSLLVASDEANAQQLTSVGIDKAAISAEDGSKESAEGLEAGMIIKITYDGSIAETYPAQIAADTIEVQSIGEDLVTLYTNVIREIYKTDDGLNSGMEMIAFDLSGVNNITESEKAALMYQIGGEYGYMTVSGTFDELASEGYINKEQLSFDKGILITITQNNSDNADSFTFSAKKWRGGDGAVFFDNCKAEKKDGNWQYTLGGFAIS